MRCEVNLVFTVSGRNVPAILSANPGNGSLVKVYGDSDNNDNPTIFDLTELLAENLSSSGQEIEKGEDWILLKESGYFLLPQFVSVQSTAGSNLVTMTTIQINHDSLSSKGVFEFQHASGKTLQDSFLRGFNDWREYDLPPLLDCLRPESFGGSIVLPALRRRIIFGPASRVVFGASQSELTKLEEDDSHRFCDCCLFTNSIKSFEDLIESDAFCCLRLFAARDGDGQATADCRLNGEEFPLGAEALINYVLTWPGNCSEIRKQYVVLHNLEQG